MINSPAYARAVRQQSSAQRVYDAMEPPEDDDDQEVEDSCAGCPNMRRGCSDDCPAY